MTFFTEECCGLLTFKGVLGFRLRAVGLSRAPALAGNGLHDFIELHE
jgi:hypothetical protein